MSEWSEQIESVRRYLRQRYGVEPSEVEVNRLCEVETDNLPTYPEYREGGEIDSWAWHGRGDRPTGDGDRDD